MNASFQRAFAESTVGHFVIAGLAAIILTISQCARPVQPDEIMMDVAIITGAKSLGELGAPPLESAAQENKPAEPVVAPPPPPPPEPATPPIREPDPIKVEEPKPAEIPKPVEVPKPPKPVDKPKAEERTPPRDPPPPQPVKHEVKVSTKLVDRKIDAPPSTSKTPPKSSLTKEQIAALLKSGVNLSKYGGASVTGGGKPGSIETGALGSAMDMYKAALKAKIYNAWMRPAGVDGLLTVIHISITRDGTIISPRITRRSGNDLMDESAMQALRNVRPASLPAGADAPFQLDVEFEASGVSV